MAERVAIVGGGFSGLLCAYLLEQLYGDRVEAHLFEEADRLGGRLRTTSLPEVGGDYEAGVAELYDIAGNPHLRDLVRHLDLETRRLTGTPFFVARDQIVRDDRDLAHLLGARGIDQLRRFWDEGTRLRPPERYAQAGQPHDNEHPWSSRTFEEVLAEIEDPAARWFTAMQCHSDLAAEPHQTSGLFGFDNLLIDHPDYCTMYTLSGGNEGLVRALAERVRTPLRTGAAVEAIEANDAQGLRVRVATAEDGVGTLDVDSIVVTLTPPALAGVGWSDQRLASAIDAHLRHHDHAATYLRVTLLFRRRFWDDRFPEDYFVSDAFDGVTVYDQSPTREADAHGVQSWLLGGEAAAQWARRRDTEVVDAVRAAMPDALSDAERHFLTGVVDRWEGPRGVSALPGGVPLQGLETRHCPDRRWPQLILVGDYLYDSTICGALDAVLWAVTRIGQRMGDATPDPLSVFSRPAASGPDDPASGFFHDQALGARR